MDYNYNDNYKYNVLIIILWEYGSSCRNYNYREERYHKYHWNNFQSDIFQLMNNRNIDSQSESIWLQLLKYLKQQTT